MTRAHEAGRIPVITPGHRCRIARETAGLDQTQLAELMGISRTSVSNVELGKHEPRKIVINAWAMATGVPVSWLQTGEVPDPERITENVPSVGFEPTAFRSEGARLDGSAAVPLRILRAA